VMMSYRGLDLGDGIAELRQSWHILAAGISKISARDLPCAFEEMAGERAGSEGAASRSNPSGGHEREARAQGPGSLRARSRRPGAFIECA
jgi:hypothetical protein